MDDILDTYDPNWETVMTTVADELDQLYAELQKSDGLSKLHDPAFRQRQAAIREQETTVMLSQFRTLPDCTEHYKNELISSLRSYMQDFQRYGKVLDGREMLVDTAFHTELRAPDTEPEMPSSLAHLTEINGLKTMSTARDVYDQFNLQYETLEQNFLHIMRGALIFEGQSTTPS